MRELWINLVSKDIKKARDFYQALGFVITPRFTASDEVTSLIFNENTLVLMIFNEQFFKDKLPDNIYAGAYAHEVLLSISASSIADADELVAKAIAAGGKALGEPLSDGSMYNTGFIDLDGHWWNILFYSTN